MLSNSSLGIDGVADVSPSFEFRIETVQQVTAVEFFHLLHGERSLF